MTSKLIIQTVKAHPELWCTTHPNYKNRFLKERVIRGIALEMGLKPDIFKKKWKNVKDQFRKEIRKQMAFNDENGVFECHWPYWEDMEFMRMEIMLSMSGGPTNAGTVSPGGTMIPCSPEIVKTESYDGHPLVTGEYEDSQSEVDHILTEVDPLNDLESETSHVQSNKRGGTDLQEPPAKHFASDRSYGEIRDADWVDEDYHFCMSLLPTLKSLSKIQKLEFRGKVNQWLLDAVLQNQQTT
ncbi:hypothetical protein GE061_007062 [Apolygus lucorum]|uniref:MADF domain-containing protein n=1 Tax=Apolygus lucorum TaxID=248454 RepID=A0A8S9WQW1_APOLU|nr:hypothetical protein GE061_007062 [Apolygus lucorum]